MEPSAQLLQEAAPGEERRGRGLVGRPAAKASILGLAAAAGLWLLLRAPAGQGLATVAEAPEDGIIKLDENPKGNYHPAGTYPEACEHYPFLKYLGARYSNLARKGPNTSFPEGIAFDTIDLGKAAGPELNHKILMYVNASHEFPYVPWVSRLNGMQGKYGSINIHSGSKLKMRIHFREESTNKIIKMHRVAFTFFDLDTGVGGMSVESVTVHSNKLHYDFLTENTEVQREDLPDGSIKFSASTYGTGEDNPLDPMFLTQQQKNRAVSMMFHDTDELHFTIAASKGRGPRFFTFVSRPSLMCAVTVQKGFKPPLPDLDVVPPLQKGVQTIRRHETFQEYKVQKGDRVTQGQVVCVCKEKDGSLKNYKAPFDGTVVATQPLYPGEQVDLRLSSPKIFAVIEKDKTPALPVKEGGAKVGIAPKGTTFVEIKVKPGDEVEKDDVIAVLDKNGEEQDIKTDRKGVIAAVQDDIKKGDPVEIIEDRNLATIERYQPLDVGTGQASDNVTGNPLNDGNWKFKEWRAEVDQEMQEGDPIALVEHTNGTQKVVVASKDGPIVSRQEHLSSGDVIGDVLEDGDLAVIGKFSPISIGMFDKEVAADKEAIFEEWAVHDGDHVQVGDTIAYISPPGRRLANGRRLREPIAIPSPAFGTVVSEQPLKPGQKIGDQQVDGNIAKIDMGLPWWLWLLLALLALCCLLCLLLLCCRSKPKSEYKPMPPVEDKEPEPSIVEEPVAPYAPKPEGVRLDFEENGARNTVYAKYRPLGIKHNSVAPIVAHDFMINSYSKSQLGVKDNWKLVRIGDEELNNSDDFEQVNGKLTEHLKNLPLWPLPLHFKPSKEGGAQETVLKFVERPIGLEFDNRAPIQVNKIYEGSPAEKAGIQDGWLITRIAECDVHENSNFREVMSIFKEGVQPLDEGGRKYD